MLKFGDLSAYGRGGHMEVFCSLADRPRFGRLKEVAQRREVHIVRPPVRPAGAAY